MRHETTIKTPASAASGIWLITGASTNMASKMPSAWKMPVRRVTAPDFTATLVRAIAAVAGMPPKKRHYDVANALRQKFTVAVEPCTGHTRSSCAA